MRVLLSSVFKPFAVDDAFGRKENVVELFHNQVTREQGVFSLRMNHPSGGLHLIAANLKAPTLVLDFPSREEFEREVKRGYDVVGLSFIVPNFEKAKWMASRVRALSPHTRIVLGGHGTTIPGLEQLIEHDAICRGEGVYWMRRYLQEDVDAPLKHPAVPAAFNRRFLGAPVNDSCAMLFPGNGCVNACDFCCTSHFFQRQYTPYFKTGGELFEVLCDLERKLGSREFFVLDENFLKSRARAEELAALMERHGKQWSFGVFSSAESISQYGWDFLSRLGIYFLWIGVESKRHVYAKNQNADLRALISGLRQRGTAVLASGILFLEHHTKENIWEDVDYLIGLEPDFLQFMQLGPLPGTALYERMKEEGRLRLEVPYEEWHGQHQIWFEHPHFSPAESEWILREAFRRDFLTHGPSMLRMVETYLMGYRHLEHSTDPFLRGRRKLMEMNLAHHRPALLALERLAPTPAVRARATLAARALTDILGPMDLKTRSMSVAALGTALAESFRLSTLGSARQPPTLWTPYRLEPAPWHARVREVLRHPLNLPILTARGLLAGGARS